MATLYVENVPDEIYRALRRTARENRKSIAAEVISLLECHIPTAKELQRRREFYEQMRKLRTSRTDSGSFPSTEEAIREDRSR